MSLDGGKAGYLELYGLTGQAKLKAIIEYASELQDKGVKFLLFVHHSDVMDRIYGSLKRPHECNIIRIDGAVPSLERQDLCNRFQTDETVRIALLSITAASVGLTLTRANVVVFGELFWNPGVFCS